MDPILTKAANRLMRQADIAEKSGIDFTPDMQESFMRENTSGQYGVADAFQLLQEINTGIGPRNVGRSLAQGALFNFADEIVGLGPGGEGRKEEMRLRESLYAREHPYANMAGQFAGGLVMPGGAAMKAAGSARGLGGAVVRGAGIGAGAGALAGAGMGESGEERASGATGGAGFGALLGGAFPAVAGTLRLAASPGARASRRMGEAVTASGGVAGLRASRDALVAAGRGNEAAFADLSPYTQGLLDFVATQDPKAFVQVKTMMRGRQSFMSDRLLTDVKKLLGNPHAETELRKMKEELSAWAKSPEGFEGLRQQNPQLENVEALGELAQYLKQPKVQNIWKTAKEERLIGVEPDVGSPSFELLHTLKQKLDRAVSKAWASPGERDLARDLGGVRDVVDETLEKMVPEYAARNAKYRTGIMAQKALVLGTKWVNKADNQELMNVVSGMTPSQLDAFRKGFVSQLLLRLRTKSNKNIAAEVLNDKSLQERMNIVFGDQQVFDDLMGRASAEGQMAETAGAVQGSPTARRTAEASYDPAQMVGDVARGAAFGPMAAAQGMLSKLPSAMAPRTARALAPDLMTQGTPAIDALLAKLSQRGQGQAVPPWMQGQVPRAAGGIAPNLFGQQEY